jgi:1-acyl-sn-glycerol-3-phosphate acyltransferase
VSGDLPPPSEPRLDGEPGEPLRPPRGGRRALGRDPFEERGADPFLAKVVATGGRPPVPRSAAPDAHGEQRPLRLDELGPPVDPAARSRWLGAIDPRRLEALRRQLPAGHATDEFGLSPHAVERTLPFFLGLYRHWFRVRSEGHAHLPAEGPAILVGNHGGLLPFDGAMTVLDVFLHSDPPRLPRALVDRFVSRVPWLHLFYTRVGQVLGTRARFRELLGGGQLVLVFPEGVAGITKPISQRYRLQPFHPGFVEEALRLRVPIVPVAIAGADDQAPILYDVRPLARWLGLPAVPVTPTFPWLGPLGLLPYPVRYRIRYGEPIRLHERHGPEAAEEPRLVRDLTCEVRRIVQRMLDRTRS